MSVTSLTLQWDRCHTNFSHVPIHSPSLALSRKFPLPDHGALHALKFPLTLPWSLSLSTHESTPHNPDINTLSTISFYSSLSPFPSVNTPMLRPIFPPTLRCLPSSFSVEPMDKEGLGQASIAVSVLTYLSWKRLPCTRISSNRSTQRTAEQVRFIRCPNTRSPRHRVCESGTSSWTSDYHGASTYCAIWRRKTAIPLGKSRRLLR